MRVGEGFASQVCNPFPELIVTCCDEASPLSIEGVTNGEFGVVAVTVSGKVWGI